MYAAHASAVFPEVVHESANQGDSSYTNEHYLHQKYKR
jgi:hypothetical protein